MENKSGAKKVDTRADDSGAKLLAAERAELLAAERAELLALRDEHAELVALRAEAIALRAERDERRERDRVAAMAELAAQFVSSVSANSDSGLLTELAIAAARDGSGILTQKAIDAGCDMRARAPNAQTALHFAAEQKRSGAVQALLDAGLDPNAVDDYGDAPLAVAAKRGSIACVAALLAGGACPNSKSKWGGSPAMGAAHARKWDVVEALWRAGADLTEPNEDGETAITLARKAKGAEENPQVNSLLTAIDERAQMQSALGPATSAISKSARL